jgi:virginiamycin B lyase
MSARKSTDERKRRTPLAAWVATVARSGIGAPLLAALLVVTLALAPRAEAYIYWTDPDGTIGRANLDGTGVDESFISAAGSPCGLAVDDAHIYWAGGFGKTIARANLDGTDVEESFISHTNPNPCGVAVDDAHVYWATETGTPGVTSGTGTLARANLNGTGIDESFITGLDFPSGGVAVDDSRLYWINSSPDEIGELYGGPNRIGRANLDGTGVEEDFITAAPSITGVALDDTHIWLAHWGRFDAGILRTTLEGTGREGFLFGNLEDPDQPVPCGIAVNDTHVYWIEGNSIGRASLDRARVSNELITGISPAGGCGLAADALGPPPSNEFRFAKLKRNKRKGTVKLTMNVAGPGELDLDKTRRINADEESAEASGKEKLSVKARRKARKQLSRNGKAKVKARVTFTPEGGEPRTKSKRVKLIKRR